MVLPIFESRTLSEALQKSMQVDSSLFLVPVGSWILGDHETISSLTEWRRATMNNFFSSFEVSTNSMSNYLQTKSVGQSNRILFLIRQNNRFVGHLGLSNIDLDSAEIDNVMKSQNKEFTISSEEMYATLEFLLGWAADTLGVKKFTLQVKSTNQPAINLYKRAGFTIQKSESPGERKTHDSESNGYSDLNNRTFMSKTFG